MENIEKFVGSIRFWGACLFSPQRREERQEKTDEKRCSLRPLRRCGENMLGTVVPEHYCFCKVTMTGCRVPAIGSIAPSCMPMQPQTGRVRCDTVPVTLHLSKQTFSSMFPFTFHVLRFTCHIYASDSVSDNIERSYAVIL